jgi:hypothetical protein
MRLKEGSPERDEHAQALALARHLRVLDSAGVEGAFVMTFVTPTAPYDEDPSRDLDKNSYSLVRTLADVTGATFPGLPWEPKEAFWAVAEFYRMQEEGPARQPYPAGRRVLGSLRERQVGCPYRE